MFKKPATPVVLEQTPHYLDQEDRDLPPYDGPRRHYILCATPRCGSTLLCDLLAGCGRMGVPHEYLHAERHVPALASRLGLISNKGVELDQYITAIKRIRTTPNGVFGCKFHFNHFHSLCRKTDLNRHFPDAVFLYATRHDKLAQAVSLAIAQQTRQWTSLHEELRKPTYNADAIAKALNTVVQMELAWQTCFALHGLSPLTVAYEDLLADADGVCRQVLREVGVDSDHTFTLANATIGRQRTEANQEWAARFRMEKKMF
ncbi:MAG: Stf0 family sulfotransferase [Desulfovibrionaceae bacterium]